VPRAATQVTRKTAARKGPAKPTLTQIERRLGHPGLFAEVRTSLQAAFGPRLKGLVLYGSQARGDAGPESDVDILVLLDEPWSNIDPMLRGAMRDDLAEILRSVEATVLLVTHDREEAFSLADRIALMREGRIVQSGVAEDVYLAPSDRWAAEFAGAGNFLRGTLADGHVETPVGRFPALNPNGHTDVEVVIRPELLLLDLDPAGDAEVVAREFRGHDVFYRVRLADGQTVVSHRPSTEVVPLGARVALRVHAAHVPIVG